MRRLSFARALLATAVLAAWALGWAAWADASPAQLTKAEREPDAITASVDPGKQRVVALDVRDGEVDQSSIRDVAPPSVTDRSRAGSGSDARGRASAAFLAAFLLAGAVVALVAAASRVRSSWPA
jgi:hypothetical protein